MQAACVAGSKVHKLAPVGRHGLARRAAGQMDRSMAVREIHRSEGATGQADGMVCAR